MGKLQRRQKHNFRQHKRLDKEILAEIEPEPIAIPEQRAAPSAILIKCRICNITFASARAKAVHKKSAMHKRNAKNETELDTKEDEMQVGLASLSM